MPYILRELQPQDSYKVHTNSPRLGDASAEPADSVEDPGDFELGEGGESEDALTDDEERVLFVHKLLHVIAYKRWSFLAFPTVHIVESSTSKHYI